MKETVYKTISGISSNKSTSASDLSVATFMFTSKSKMNQDFSMSSLQISALF